MNWIEAVLVMWLVWTLFDGFAKSARKFHEWDQIVKRNQGRR